MPSRQKFIAQRPKPKKKMAEEEWLIIPDGYYLSVRHTTTEYSITIPAKTKYRINEKRIEALQFNEDEEGLVDIFITAPFVSRMLKEEVEEPQ